MLFAASVVRSAFGFGEALIAVPLLALLIPVEGAAPVAVLASITISILALAQDWRHVHLKSAGWLVASTMAGLPFGLLVLKTVSEPLVKAVLGMVIIAFSTYVLMSRTQRELRDDRLAMWFGFAAGVLGGAYGMNGPPLVVYGSLRRWRPSQFRATLQGYFLPASMLGMAGYWAAGLWTPSVTRLYLVSLPGILIATLLGRIINRRTPPERFLLLIHCGLILIGLVLLVQAAA